MNCPTCNKPGYEPPKKGRPFELDDNKVRKLHEKGLSLREIAAEMGCTHGAIALILKRKTKGKKS
jgi:DNA invertase Pin-like site-specific DNA recombinase